MTAVKPQEEKTVTKTYPCTVCGEKMNTFPWGESGDKWMVMCINTRCTSYRAPVGNFPGLKRHPSLKTPKGEEEEQS